MIKNKNIPIYIMGGIIIILLFHNYDTAIAASASIIATISTIAVSAFGAVAAGVSLSTAVKAGASLSNAVAACTFFCTIAAIIGVVFSTIGTTAVSAISAIIASGNILIFSIIAYDKDIDNDTNCASVAAGSFLSFVVAIFTSIMSGVGVVASYATFIIFMILIAVIVADNIKKYIKNKIYKIIYLLQILLIMILLYYY